MKRCVRLRQQIGARLEVLASLADKQIAQEDANEQHEDVKPTASSSNTNNGNGNPGTFGGPIDQEKPASAGTVASARMNHQPPTETQSQPAVKSVAMTSPSVFPDAPMPTSLNVPQYGTSARWIQDFHVASI